MVVSSRTYGQTIQTGAFFRAGQEAPAEATLPMAADLNMMAQKHFKQQGPGNKENWDLAFENGYLEGFKKTHRAP